MIVHAHIVYSSLYQKRLSFTDDIYSSLDNSETVVGIYIDLQKAFDCVNHNILLYKLYNYMESEVLLMSGLSAT